MKRGRRPARREPPRVAVRPAATPGPNLPRAAWGVLLLALGLRLWHLAEGLPDFFEEAFPLRRAFEMAGWERGRVDWNPNAFHYPSLSFYLHLLTLKAQYLLGRGFGVFHRPGDFFLAFQVDPSAVALGGRALGVIADLATLVAVARIGERMRRGAGLLAAMLVAVCATLIRQSHVIVTDGIMTAFAAWALERMLAYRRGGGLRAAVAAVACTGLAAGTKYPAALLVVPLGFALASRPGRARWLAVILALAGAAAVFLATSPYLLTNLAQVGFDWLRMANLVTEGQLGTFGHPSAVYYLKVFASDFGWIAPVLLAMSLLWLRRRPHGPRETSIVWLFLLAFLVPILLGRAEFERYLAPVTPAAALLLAVTALALPELLPALGETGRAIATALLVLAVAVPACWAGFQAAAVGGDTTQAQARRFVESRLSPDQLLVEEAHGAPLRDRWEFNRITATSAFALADSSWRRRYQEQPIFRVVKLPLLVAGRAVMVVPDSARGRREIQLFPSTADLNRVFYEPALYAGIDWVLTSDAVRGRYEADSSRYRAQHRFYRLLDRLADQVTVLRSGGTVTGPEIRIYRVGARFHQALGDTLDPLWWTRDVPEAARRDLDRTMRAAERPRSDLDAPPLWVLALGTVFERQIEPFAYSLALELADLGRCDQAMAMSNAILRMDPEQVQATGIVATCAEARGDFARARAAIARLLSAGDPAGHSMADIRLEYARLLAQTGARDEARRQIGRVLSAPLSTGETQRRAREMMKALARDSTP